MMTGRGEVVKWCSRGIRFRAMNRKRHDSSTKSASHPRVIAQRMSKTHMTRPQKINFQFNMHSTEAFFELPELDENTFFTFLRHHKEVVVMFYDPFCPHCRKVMPEFAAASRMVGRVAFATVDGPSNQVLTQKHGVEKYPTIRFYQFNQGTFRFAEFTGENTKKEFVDFIQLSLRKAFSTSSPVAISQNRSFSTKTIVGKKFAFGDHIVQLNGENFMDKIKELDSVLVMFYTSWCADCSVVMGKYLKISDDVSPSECTMAVCNAEDSEEIVDSFFVSRIPTLKYFRNGQFIANYSGDLNGRDVLKFIKGLKSRKEEIAAPDQEPVSAQVFVPILKKKFWEGVPGSHRIIDLTSDNFDDVLKKYDSILVLFYAVWNKNSLNLRSDYVALANMTNPEKIELGACDCEDNIEIADRFNIAKFPSFKYFRNQKFVANYFGEHTADSMLKFLRDPSKLQLVKESPKYSVQQVSSGFVPSYWKGIEGGEYIVHVQDSTVEDSLKKYRSFLLMFYVSWCKSCSVMKREYGLAAKKIPKDLGKLGACDAVENNEVADKYLVTKLPTIKFFQNGLFIADFVGVRSAHEIISFMENPITEGGKSVSLNKFGNKKT